MTDINIDDRPVAEWLLEHCHDSFRLRGDTGFYCYMAGHVVEDLPAEGELVVEEIAGQYTDAFFKELADWYVRGHLRHLRVLRDESYRDLSDEAMKAISQLASLERFESEGTPSPTGLLHLAQLPGLMELTIAGTNLTDDGLAALCRLPALRSLDIAHASVSDHGIAALASAPRLSRVNLAGASVTPDGIAQLRRIAPHLDVQWSPPFGHVPIRCTQEG